MPWLPDQSTAAYRDATFSPLLDDSSAPRPTPEFAATELPLPTVVEELPEATAPLPPTAVALLAVACVPAPTAVELSPLAVALVPNAES